MEGIETRTVQRGTYPQETGMAMMLAWPHEGLWPIDW